MQAIAYAASIGGMATLIGTPPNLVLAGVIKNAYGIEIGFLDWFLFAFPFALLLLFLCWFYLSKIAYRFDAQTIPGGEAEIRDRLKGLGPMQGP